MSNSDWYSPESPNNGSDLNDTDTTTTVIASPSPNCTFSLPSPSSYSMLPATLCGFYFAFGLVCAFFGYRCFKAIMFFTGFVFASVVVYLICMEDDNKMPLWSVGLISLSAGILFGLITLLVQYVGLFMLGFHSGLLLGIVGLGVADVWDEQPASPWISVGILIVAGLVMALLNLCFQKSLTIFGSALYGGAILSTTLDYFMEHSSMLVWVWHKVTVQESKQPCWYSWAVLGIWPAVLITGIITQVACTGRGMYHESQFPSANETRNRNGGKSETREERKQRKYRYLYQVRTCHGDVISQPIPRKYVQKVNEPSSA